MMMPTRLCREIATSQRGANPLGLVVLALVLIGCGAVSPTPPAERSTEEPSTSEAPTASAGADAPAPEPTAPSALNLILEAHANGDLTDEEAAVYRAFAAFGDERLPDEFRSDTGYEDGLALRAAAGMWDELSTANQEALAPYFIPPIYAGSWADPAGESTVSLARHPARGPVALNPTDCASEQLRDQSYVNVPAMDGRVRIWWRDGIETSASFASTASAVAAEIDATIWPTLTGLMGREPLSDEAQGCFNGEDGAVDIYLSDRTLEGHADAMTIAYPGRCTETPAFIIVAQDTVVDDGLPLWVVAHELFHTIQYAYHYAGPCDKFTAMDEATAMWAARHVYPDDQFEWTGGTTFDPRSYALWFRHREDNIYWHGMTCYGYCGWPYFASLTERHGVQRIADLYEATEAAPTDFAAIDAVTPGGIRGFWPQFVRDLFDDHPGWNVWADWDPSPWSRYTQHTGGGGIPTDNPFGAYTRWRFGLWELPCQRAGELGANETSLRSYELLGMWSCVPDADQEDTDLPPDPGTRSYDIEASVSSMTRDESLFWFASDEWPRYVRIERPGMGNESDDFSVQGLYELADGSLHGPFDWKSEEVVEFCRDEADEDVVFVAILFGNSAPFSVADQASDVNGTYRVEVRETCPMGFRIEGTIQGNFTNAPGTSLTFSGFANRLDPDDPIAVIGEGTMSGTLADCSTIGQGVPKPMQVELKAMVRVAVVDDMMMASILPEGSAFLLSRSTDLMPIDEETYTETERFEEGEQSTGCGSAGTTTIEWTVTRIGEPPSP